MPITSMSVNVGGLVTYNDGSVDEFNVSYFDALSVDHFSDNQQVFEQLYNGKASSIDAILTALGGTHTLTPAAPGTPKTVNDFTFNYSGQITRDDGSKDSFRVTWDRRVGSDVQGAAVYAEVLAEAAWLAVLDTLFELLVGTGNAAIAA